MANSMSFDTLDIVLRTDATQMIMSSFIEDIVVDSNSVGTLLWDADRRGDAVYTDVALIRDSIKAFGIGAHVKYEKPDILIHADTIVVFDRSIDVSANAPVIVSDTNVYFEHFTVNDSNTEIVLDGDFDEYDLQISGLGLQPDQARGTQCRNFIECQAEAIRRYRDCGFCAVL